MAFDKSPLGQTIKHLTERFNQLIDDLLSTLAGKGASQIGIEDAGNYYTAENVEGALAQLGGAPPGAGVVDASYLTLASHTGLTAERVLTAGTNIAFVDTGANGTLTVSTISSPTHSSITLDTPLAVSSGGTGASTAAGARSNLGAAISGTNTDITALQGLNKENALQLSPYGTLTGNTGGIRFLELAANGVNFVGFKAADSIPAEVMWTLPNSDGTAGQMLVTNGAKSLSWATPAAVGVELEKLFSQAGTLATKIGTLRWYPRGTITLESVFICVNTPPAGQAIIVDVNKNGTTVFTDQTKRPTIAAGAFTATSGTPDVTSVTPTDYIQIDIDQVGTTDPGADLTISVRYS